MSLLQESFVYILLLPLTLNIVLPLAILVARLICLPFFRPSRKRKVESVVLEEMQPA